jgi:hypothetical protein
MKKTTKYGNIEGKKNPLKMSKAKHVLLACHHYRCEVRTCGLKILLPSVVDSCQLIYFYPLFSTRQKQCTHTHTHTRARIRCVIHAILLRCLEFALLFYYYFMLILARPGLCNAILTGCDIWAI